VLSFKTESDQKATFFLGAYPNELTNGNLPFSKCSTGTDWKCKISRINVGEYKDLSDGKKLGNDTTSYDDAFFSFSSVGIYAPIYALQIINANYFNGTLNSTNGTGCTTETILVNGINNTGIVCPPTFDTTKASDLSFAFDETALRMNGSNLFINNYDGKNNSLFNIGFIDGVHHWTFGTSFLKNFITVFDGDSQSVGFYGPDVTNFSSNKTTMTIIIILAAGIGVLTILFIVFLCRRKPTDDGYSAQN